MVAVSLSAEDPSLGVQQLSSSPSTAAATTTEPASPTAKPVDQLRAAIGQAVVIGGTSTTAFTVADQESMPAQGGPPEGLRAVDTALEAWGQPTAGDVTVPLMPARRMVPDANMEDELAADALWGEGRLAGLPSTNGGLEFAADLAFRSL
jgi:hypothetical protein